MFGRWEAPHRPSRPASVDRQFFTLAYLAQARSDPALASGVPASVRTAIQPLPAWFVMHGDRQLIMALYAPNRLWRKKPIAAGHNVSAWAPKALERHPGREYWLWGAELRAVVGLLESHAVCRCGSLARPGRAGAKTG